MREDLPLLRSSLAPEYAELDGEALGELIESLYGPGATPEDVENLFKKIGSGFKKAAGAVGGFAGKALPGMLSGAMTGATVGGPWGALVGAVAGGAGSALSKSKNKTARGIGGAIGGIGNLISSARGGGAAGGLGGLLSKAAGGGGAGNILSMVRGAGAGGALGSLASVGAGALKGVRPPGIPEVPGGGAANALLGMLSRPETLQALLSGTLGSFGKQAVAVGGQQIPVHSMLSALGTLAGEAAQEAAELDESAAEAVPGYVEWAEGFGVDPESAEGRKDSVLLALALAPSMWASQNRPVVVNVTNPEPHRSDYSRESAWAELDESDESDEAFEQAGEAWETEESWQDGEDLESWMAGEAGWDEEESIHAWQ